MSENNGWREKKPVLGSVVYLFQTYLTGELERILEMNSDKSLDLKTPATLRFEVCVR